MSQRTSTPGLVGNLAAVAETLSCPNAKATLVEVADRIAELADERATVVRIARKLVDSDYDDYDARLLLREHLRLLENRT